VQQPGGYHDLAFKDHWIGKDGSSPTVA
jgi:hypothetical protein